MHANKLHRYPRTPVPTSPTLETPVSHPHLRYSDIWLCVQHLWERNLPAHCKPICAKMTLLSLIPVSTLARQEGKGSEKLVPA